jgi:hypothetical protein
MLALALLAFGALLLWAALTGRGDAIVNALNISLPRVAGSGGSGAPPSEGNRIVPNPPESDDDPGEHQGISADGVIYTIKKAYKNMTDGEKDDANRYAHEVGDG